MITNKQVNLITVFIVSILLTMFVLTTLKEDKLSDIIAKNITDSSSLETTSGYILRPVITIKPKNDYKEYEIDYQHSKGVETEILLNNCYSFYFTYWTKIVTAYPDTKEYFDDLIKNLKTDIKLKKISNNIAIVERTATSMSIDNLVKVEDIWVFKNETWVRFNNFSNQGYRAKLLNLNGDEYPDVLIQGGCCGNETFNVLIGDKDHILINTQNIDYHGITKLDYKEGKAAEIICKPDEGEKGEIFKLVFDKKQNIFLIEEY